MCLLLGIFVMKNEEARPQFIGCLPAAMMSARTCMQGATLFARMKWQAYSPFLQADLNVVLFHLGTKSAKISTFLIFPHRSFLVRKL